MNHNVVIIYQITHVLHSLIAFYYNFCIFANNIVNNLMHDVNNVFTVLEHKMRDFCEIHA